jgi:starch-binding outer membrane protein, SusD/RagB family
VLQWDFNFSKKLNMKTGIKNIVQVLLVAFLVSCSDWLNLIPPEGLIREEFWKTKEDVEAVLMGAYETMASLDNLFFLYGELRGDMITGDYNEGDSEKKIAESNIYPDNYLCNWSNFYKVINYCNDVLKNAPLVQKIDNTFTDYRLQNYMAEAYFIRSLSYFYLVRLFKDVPLVLEPTETDDTDFYLPKTSGEEILAQITKDLEGARNYAASDSYTTLAEIKGRTSKAAIDALLADIALWNFNYEKCIEYVNRIQAVKDIVLMPSTKYFEMYYPGNSLESIFEFQFDNSLNQNNKTYGLTNRYSYNIDPSNKAIQMFARKYANELVRGEDISIKKYGEDDYIIWKYVGRAPDGKTVRTGTDQYSCNWIVYRLADVLLMKAEALSQLGRYTEAIEIINTIRIRADVPPLTIANSQSAFEDAILEERAYELAFEGKRWFDLLRMGRRNNYARKEKLIEVIIQNVPSTQKRILAAKLSNPLGWYLPIYETELERNKNLVQNPYYNY